MKIFLAFVFGVLVGFVAQWYIGQPRSAFVTVSSRSGTPVATNNQTPSTTDGWDAEKIKDELNRTGKVIREKSEQAGHALADATANARITTAIKARLVRDSGLSAFKIDVNTTDGVVTLAGSVSSYDQIARAVQIALDTDGVQRVISTLQVKT